MVQEPAIPRNLPLCRLAWQVERETRFVNRRSFSSRALMSIAIAAGLLSACASDSDPSAVSSVAVTTTPAAVTTSTPPTTIAATTTVASTSTTTIESTTTTTPPVVGWSPVDSLPALAYPPCCGSNWTGAPSPTIAADANTPLAPGMYYATRLSSDTATDSITFEVS
ncbi:MAG: hypothetical protein JWN99_3329, partial [Ilumatobacteraceae bacterium]|nr:hypothetical protein [Ilumatobacteraceae bacterium]